MISWEKYLTEAITTFRREFERLSLKDQKYIRKKVYDDLPFEPCQVEVLDFGIDKKIVFLLVHDKGLPDLKFNIHKKAKSMDESEFTKKYNFGFLDSAPLDQAYWQKLFPTHRLFIYTKISLRLKEMMSPQELAQYLLSNAKEQLRNEQVELIKHSTDGLRETIEKIPEKDIRNELLTNTKKIDMSLLEIKRLDEEIGKVRHLVGITKEIQDWKLLVTDVNRLKGEHVPKEVFDAKIERLDEKIEKGLENLNKRVDEGIKALNTRIEDLKAMKFWSKRTLLDIALALLATVATLFAAGILKF